MVLCYLAVIRITHNYVITVIRATLNSLIVYNTKSIITGARKYLVIKKTLFAFRKKFATTSNNRRYI